MFYVKFIKFGLVGASGLIIDFFVTWLLKEKLHFNKYVANSFGFILAVSNNYILNRIYTFQNSDANIGEQFTSFLIIALIGFGINMLLLYLLQTYTKTNFYVFKIIITLIVFIWNFGANNWYTFK